jgi:hypothetical protein
MSSLRAMAIMAERSRSPYRRRQYCRQQFLFLYAATSSHGLWLRYQPGSELAEWFRKRVGTLLVFGRVPHDVHDRLSAPIGADKESRNKFGLGAAVEVGNRALSRRASEARRPCHKHPICPTARQATIRLRMIRNSLSAVHALAIDGFPLSQFPAFQQHQDRWRRDLASTRNTALPSR